MEVIERALTGGKWLLLSYAQTGGFPEDVASLGKGSLLVLKLLDTLLDYDCSVNERVLQSLTLQITIDLGYLAFSSVSLLLLLLQPDTH